MSHFQEVKYNNLGTTVLCLLIGPHLFTANVGDSRAILISE
ncbi:MAG: PP2C family serine/threonine-protein phosphatase [bacterium]